MGANKFQTTCNGENVVDAFAEAVRRARYDFGNAGYTGTIAEKSDFHVVDVPEGHTAQELVDVFQEFHDKNEIIPALTPLIGETEATEAAEAFDDKWGPCVAIKVDETVWYFAGWASC